jgi:hypothetical protein
MPTTTVDTTLPTWEQLEAFWSRTSNLVEELDAEIAKPVYQLTQREDEQPVTFEQIGALLMFVRWMREQEGYLEETLGKLEQLCFEDLDTIRREGRMIDPPTFTEYGQPTPPPTAREVAEWIAGEKRGGEDA